MTKEELMVNKLELPAKVWGFMKSLKLAIFLIISITVAVTVDIVILAGQWDPSPASFARRAGEAYSHSWFLALVFLLLLNLTACTIDSTVRKIKARRTGFGRWGSTVFHAGLILILLGTFATGAFRTLATIKLIEGETKQVPYNALVTKSLEYAPGGVMLSFTLQKQELEADSAGRVKNVDSWIDLSDGADGFAGRRLADLEKFYYRNIYLFPSTYGYAIRLNVKGPQGKKVTDLTVPLESMEYDGGLKAYAKTNFPISDLPYDFSVDFYPDFAKITGSQGGYSANYPDRLGQPGMYVRAALNGTIISQKIVRPGDSMDVQGYSVVFEQVKPWTQLVSVYDPGATLVFWGISLALGGMTLFALLGRRRISVADFE